MTLGKAIVMCEYSGRVRNVLSKRGWDAWSCDLIPTETPGNHIISDSDMHSKDILYDGRWDLIIGHPPCTRLTNAVYWYILENNLEHETIAAAHFFNMILNAPARYGVAVENPIMNQLAKWLIRKQDQCIQPYMFGEDASKNTCLWLENLPKLKPTQYVPGKLIYHNDTFKERWANQTISGNNVLGPSPTRAKDRSLTFNGIAEAMAEQWTNHILNTY